MGYHFTLVRMAIIKKSTNKCLRGCGEKGTLLHCLWREQHGGSLKTELPYDPVIPLLGIHLEKNIIQKEACIPAFIIALFTTAKRWKLSKCPPTEERIKKTLYICMVEYYLAVIKNEIMPFVATRMDLETVILSEVSQAEKEKYPMTTLICGI